MTQSRYSQTQVGTPNQSTRASSATGSLPTLDDLLGPRKRDDSEEESGTVSESEVFEDDGIQNAVNSDSKVDDGQDSEPVNSKSRIGKNAEKRGAREAVNGTRGRGSGEREDSRAEKSGDLDAEDADGESYVTLMSSDGFSFVVRKSAAVRSEVIMRMLDRTNNFSEAVTGRIKLDLLTGPVLEEVCKYLYYAERNQDEIDVPDPPIPTDMCLELIVAADYLKC